MMINCAGKKLLVLGAYKSEIEIIHQARDMGVYTIVTDNHSDWELAPAKYEADEAWDISWSDIDKLERKCREREIDGCIAGFSERRIKYAQMLSARLGTRFYAEGVDLDRICDKVKFKDVCIKNNVRVPKSFEQIENVELPVIVKPADNGGSRGITVCHEKEELYAAYEKAAGYSDNGKVLIEEYITADEVMVYYTVRNGKVVLSAMCDRYMKRFGSNITQLPIGYYFPSTYLAGYTAGDDRKMRRLISSLGIRNGLIAFQAFIKDGEIIPFDPTYRLDGTMAYRAVERFGGSNSLQELISFSLAGSMIEKGTEGLKESPVWQTPCFELPVLLRKGKISRICGLEEIKVMPGVYFIYQGHTEGEIMQSDADFSQILCRIQIAASDDKNLAEAIDRIFDVLRVLDEEGQDMVIGRYRLEERRDIR